MSKQSEDVVKMWEQQKAMEKHGAEINKMLEGLEKKMDRFVKKKTKQVKGKKKK